jgi:hypothetical protein
MLCVARRVHFHDDDDDDDDPMDQRLVPGQHHTVQCRVHKSLHHNPDSDQSTIGPHPN